MKKIKKGFYYFEFFNMSSIEYYCGKGDTTELLVLESCTEDFREFTYVGESFDNYARDNIKKGNGFYLGE